MRPFVRVPVQLKGIFWGSEMRYFLRGVEIWLGNDYLGDVSGEWLADQVAQRITDLALSKRFERELEPHPLRLRPSEPPPPPPDMKALKRQQRRQRSKGNRRAS